jgi:hypothetical protein
MRPRGDRLTSQRLRSTGLQTKGHVPDSEQIRALHLRCNGNWIVVKQLRLRVGGSGDRRKMPTQIQLKITMTLQRISYTTTQARHDYKRPRVPAIEVKPD